jgi:hypothetical protein
MLTLRLIAPNDYSVHEDGQRIGRIHYASERMRELWLWTVVVTIPGPPFGSARTLDAAKAQFKRAWERFKEKHGPDELARAYAEMNHANRPGRP